MAPFEFRIPDNENRKKVSTLKQFLRAKFEDLFGSIEELSSLGITNNQVAKARRDLNYILDHSFTGGLNILDIKEKFLTVGRTTNNRGKAIASLLLEIEEMSDQQTLEFLKNYEAASHEVGELGNIDKLQAMKLLNQWFKELLVETKVKRKFIGTLRAGYRNFIRDAIRMIEETSPRSAFSMQFFLLMQSDTLSSLRNFLNDSASLENDFPQWLEEVKENFSVFLNQRKK